MKDQLHRLKSLSNEHLIDIVKNYRQYGFDELYRKNSIAILEERGIDRQTLELTGNFQNKNYDYAMDIFRLYKRNSLLAFILSILVWIQIIGIPILYSAPDILKILLVILIISVIAYFFFLIKSFFNQIEFNRITGKDNSMDMAMMYLFLGAPFYFILYGYFNNLMKEQLNEIQD